MGFRIDNDTPQFRVQWSARNNRRFWSWEDADWLQSHLQQSEYNKLVLQLLTKKWQATKYVQ
jgi:hypothetical protein